jgi:hypothetical protein
VVVSREYLQFDPGHYPLKQELRFRILLLFNIFPNLLNENDLKHMKILLPNLIPQKAI